MNRRLLEVFRPIEGEGAEDLMDFADTVADELLTPDEDMGLVNFGDEPRVLLLSCTGHLAERLFLDDRIEKIEEVAERGVNAKGYPAEVKLWGWDLLGRGESRPVDEEGRRPWEPQIKLTESLPSEEAAKMAIDSELSEAISEALRLTRFGDRVPASRLRALSRGVFRDIPLIAFDPQGTKIPTKAQVARLRDELEDETPKIKLGPVQVRYTSEAKEDWGDNYGIVC